MKKWIALLLVVLSIMLTACGDEPPVATPDTPTSTATNDEPIPTTEATQPTTTLANDRFDPEASAPVVGKWAVTVALGGQMFNLTDMEETVEVTLVYQLNGDGTYFRGIEDYHTVIAEYGAAVERFMLDRLYTKFVAEQKIQGLSKKKIEALWEETGKAGAEEQARRFVEGLYLDYRFSQLNSSGDYYEEDGVLWFSKDDRSYDPCSYTISEEGLIITEMENPRLYSQMGLSLPLLLTKVK